MHHLPEHFHAPGKCQGRFFHSTRSAFFLVATKCLEKGPFKIRLNRPVLPPSSWPQPCDYIGKNLVNVLYLFVTTDLHKPSYRRPSDIGVRWDYGSCLSIYFLTLLGVWNESKLMKGIE